MFFLWITQQDTQYTTAKYMYNSGPTNCFLLSRNYRFSFCANNFVWSFLDFSFFNVQYSTDNANILIVSFQKLQSDLSLNIHILLFLLYSRLENLSVDYTVIQDLRIQSQAWKPLFKEKTKICVVWITVF